jgi:hypothetical protein
VENGLFALFAVSLQQGQARRVKEGRSGLCHAVGGAHHGVGFVSAQVQQNGAWPLLATITWLVLTWATFMDVCVCSSSKTMAAGSRGSPVGKKALAWRRSVNEKLLQSFLRSLIKKATLLLDTKWLFECGGGTSGGRTHDKRIKSPLLYQLSYGPTRNHRL